nr:hypothetical protein [Rhizobium sp. ACO-34A]
MSFVSLLNWLATACVGIFLILPMAAIVLSSFGETAYANFPPQGFTLEWYTRFSDVPGLLEALTYSLKLLH